MKHPSNTPSTACICGACGAADLHPFTGETLKLSDGSAVPNMAGNRCAHCGEVYLDHASQERYTNASDALVLAKRQEERQMLVRVRKQLGLTQHQAAQLTGGGHNAFGRYERGEAQPMPAVLKLFQLLGNHPELLAEVR